MTNKLLHKLLAALGLCLAFDTGSLSASEPIDQLEIVPATIQLSGRRANHRLLILATKAGRQQDATADAVLVSANPNVVSIRDGVLYPTGNGSTEITASFAGQTATVPVTVTNQSDVVPVAFHSDVLAALTKAGCNMGACHGSPSGKGGFRLSLRGYDPELDLLTLRGEFFNRRSNILHPDESLLLRKPLMQVAHGGGQRIQTGKPIHQVLRNWIAEGMKTEPADSPTLSSIEVFPRERFLLDNATQQQLIVLGRFSDGTVRDLTALTAFDSSDESIATISNEGVVRREGRGEVTVLARFLDRMSTSKITFLTDRRNYQWQRPTESGPIDDLVFRKLQRLQIQPSERCNDTDFLRRATLDLAGRLPTAQEVEAFLAMPVANRRHDLIELLLATDDYAKFWSLKWADLLRCNSKRLTSTGVHKFRRWLFEIVKADTPINKFAEQLLTAQGSTQANPAANFWRASRDSLDATETTAQLFLGIRIQCAKCHNHPFEKWTQDDYYGIAAAFERVGRKPTGLPDNESIFVKTSGEVKQPRTGETMKVRLLLSGSVDVAPGEDRRKVFANWLTSETNPFFAKSVANRIWGHMMGRGIVEPVDDFRDSNPPSNPELLGWLTKEFIADGYSTKQLIRKITSSQVYQLSSKRNKFNADDEVYFSHATTRMLTAEQLLDAICQVTGVPESFPNMPVGTRAIDLADPPEGHNFLQTFGQPQRELTCECERSTDSNLGQALQLINGPVVHDKIRSQTGRLHRWIADGRTDADVISQLYVSALSRLPLASETQTSLDHISRTKDRTVALEDIAWAILNSKEFLFQH